MVNCTRSFLANKNKIAVSANNKETAINTEQTLDTAMMASINDVIQLERRREDNTNELTGKEEPDTLYNLGATSAGELNFEKAQAQHFGFLLAYGLGTVSTAAFGTGFKHTITPIASFCPNYFTLAQQFGATIFKHRLASMTVDTVKAAFVKDSWVTLNAGLKGTGKVTTNMFKETVNAPFNATSLTLAANGVEGATAQTRLDNVQHVRVKEPTTAEWIDVVVTAADAATPAVLTITAPGAAVTATDYEIMYIPTESGWMSFPSLITESPLRVTDVTFTIGGKWDGTTHLGGHTMSDEIRGVEYNLANNIGVEFRIGGTSKFANYAIRNQRIQTLSLDRELRDYFMQQRTEDDEHVVVRVKATGAEFETGKNYSAELIFPDCVVLNAPISVDGNILAEAGDLKIFEDATNGSAWVQVANKVATYAV